MATTKHTLNDASWTVIGTGPLLIEAGGFRATRLHFGASAPAISAADYHTLRDGGAFSYGGTATCYARADDANSTVIVTEGV